ncbi:MAG: DMT family transporter [Candidatus Limivivens sp.]|nr:DMT family transporter [Candidatus Limivivens sp.]
MFGILIALLSGALMSIQGVFNTEATKSTSLWVATSFVQFSALIVCLIAWFFTGRESFGALFAMPRKWALLGGVIGAFITVTVIRSVAALGPARSAMLIVVSQLLVSYIIELLGWFGVDKQPFEWKKAGGMFLAIIGIVIFKW